jgi:hypothetical protein
VWSAEKRAEGLEYMHPKPSSHSGRIVGKREVIRQLLDSSSTAKNDELHRLAISFRPTNQFRRNRSVESVRCTSLKLGKR